MDRPEGIDVSPKTGRIYIALTKNKKRQAPNTNGPNPIPHNKFGHILELIPPSNNRSHPNHIASQYKWDILLMAGDPRHKGSPAQYHPHTSPNGYLANPDNCVFDDSDRLWIASDGAQSSLNTCDGLWICPPTGPNKAQTRRFLRSPVGSEVCGPCFTPDHKTLFVSIQHPGTGKGATFSAPKTRWPDFSPDIPPRPSVVAISHKARKKVGT